MGILEAKQGATKGEKTKQKLFDTAFNLFNQYGLENITVDRIVEKAGVAKGTFYIYFESKDALIAAFISDYASKVDMDYRTVLESFPTETSSSQILLAIIEKIADTLTDNIGYTSMRTVYQLLLSDNIDTGAVTVYDRDLYQIFAVLIRRGMDKGEFISFLSLQELSRHFVMAIRGLCYEWCFRYPDFDLKSKALTHFRLLLDGIKSK